MKVINTIDTMQSCSREALSGGRTVALVPTMGCLHEGHLALIRRAREEAELVVVSLFVNPTQFGPDEDFARYPRAGDRDRALCEQEQVDVLFEPGTDEMYAPHHSVYIDESGVTPLLEGQSRPGHFRGVMTVVAKLFHATQPTLAVFGEKDAQQLWVIRKMVRDLNMPVNIISVPTVRESDGLALSSRNAYLIPEHRAQAVCLSEALQQAEERFRAGERNVYVLRKAMMDVVESHPDVEMDYIEIVDEARFVPVTTVLRPARALIAARIGGTRLIDNRLLNEAAGRP